MRRPTKPDTPVVAETHNRPSTERFGLTAPHCMLLLMTSSALSLRAVRS